MVAAVAVDRVMVAVNGVGVVAVLAVLVVGAAASVAVTVAAPPDVWL